VRAVQDFLEGNNTGVLARLCERMETAAGARQFERAALVRDIWHSLDWLDRSLRRLRVARRKYSFVYPVETDRGRTYWLAILRGQIRYGALAPQSARARRVWRNRLRQIYATPSQAQPAGGEDVEMLLLITSWFRRFPKELERVLKPRTAKRLCDG
jgi:excinuclease UvrABC nuclease subunit